MKPLEDRQDLRRAHQIRPLQWPARVVEAEDEPGVDVLRGADALGQREARLVEQLADDAPEHEPWGVADPLDVAAERAEEALGGRRRCRRSRRGPGQLDELRG